MKNWTRTVRRKQKHNNFYIDLEMSLQLQIIDVTVISLLIIKIKI
jgi:hypothetical protein